MALITMEEIEGLSPMFKGEKGHARAKRVMRMLGIDQLAERYERHEDLAGPDFVEAFLKDLNVNYQVSGMEHLAALAQGPFITVSNHPYGGLDGLILIDLVGHVREDYRVMANQFLTMVKTIKDNFISVIPATKDSIKATKESIAGVRTALLHLKENHPLGLFPSGAVSDFHLRDFRVYDREWQRSAIRLIQKANVPVVPIRFFDRNSSYFYFLGLINWKVRTLRLPKEVLNKGGKQVRIGIGSVISVEEQQRFLTTESFGKMLRERVYGMAMPDRFEARNAINFEKLSH